MITFAVIIGVLTTVLSIAVKIVGFPDQIKKNYKRKSTEGLSVPFYVLSFLVYILWVLHGILQKDWVVALGQGLGVVTTGMILYQVYIYRKH